MDKTTDYTLIIESLVRKLEAMTIHSDGASAPSYLLIDSKNDPQHVEVILDTREVTLPIAVQLQSTIPLQRVTEARAATLIAALGKSGVPIEVDEVSHYGGTRPKISMMLPNTLETVKQLRTAYDGLLLDKAVEHFQADTDKEQALANAADFIKAHTSKHGAAPVLKKFGEVVHMQIPGTSRSA